MTAHYKVESGVIVRVTNPYPGLTDHFETQGICTLREGAEAFIRTRRGPDICKARGDHDYSEKVPHTSNMYLCFRCGEPGWEMPSV